ncbi:MAG: Origin recognition complex, subunit 1 [Alectoria sarmentosa]|nr:MAG: Origin recognition complex, subunit 1 [Alectoria sarmentosa]
MATLANQGVAETLRINLSGSNALTASFKATGNAKADILNNDPSPSFTPSPPSIPPGLALFTQPTFPPEVVPKFLNPVTNPLPFTDERRHPLCVMERRSQSKQWDNSSQLMKEQKRRYVSQGRIDQGCSVALQEFGQAGSDEDDSRAGRLGGFGLDIIRLGGERWTPFGSQGKSRTGPCSPTTKSKAERARRYLSVGGVAREDSDDELGLEDLPWEWIYSKEPAKRADDERNIVGASMGDFQCMIGDCVLLKAEGTNEAWIGLICTFEENDDGEKAANFMWFSTEKEIRNKQKKRTDALPYEVYITPSWDVNPLTSINGRASIVSAETFKSKHPSGKVPRSSKDYGKIFICRRGCNTRTATYTDEFDWGNTYQSADDILALIERVQTQTKATRKRKRGDVANEDPADDWDPSNEPDEPKTPSKKRKFSQASTPTSKAKRTPQKLTTPTHKRIVIKKPLTFTPLSTRILSPHHTSSPFQLARTNLHVSSVPLTLPCRAAEFDTVYTHLEAAISAGSGACIYISGTPGTGKTATVREVVSQLNASVQAEELDDFIFVEINGMKVADPHQSYSLLWEALKGDRVSPSHALGLLEREFDHPSPRRVPCVVLMDELDQLVTKNQSVMYNFFNWPGLRHSRLIVLAVANTMDLPERTLSSKISSRLGLTRILFPGYTHEQLQEIIRSRLSYVPDNIVDPDAIQFASRKVAAVSGDARRALDICRRAVEIADGENIATEDPLLATPSKSARRKERNGVAFAHEKPQGCKVTIATVKQAINEATSSPLQQYLKALPLAAKLLLAALLARTRRSGVNECVLGDVIEEAKRLGLMAAENPNVHDFLLTDGAASAGQENGVSLGLKRGAKAGALPRVLGMGFAAAELAEAGVIGLEGGRRGDRVGKVRLGVGDEEVKLALKDDVEVRGLAFG